MKTTYTVTHPNESFNEMTLNDVKTLVNVELSKYEGEIEFTVAIDDNFKCTVHIIKMVGVNNIDALRIRGIIEDFNRRGRI